MDIVGTINWWESSKVLILLICKHFMSMSEKIEPGPKIGQADIQAMLLTFD